MSDACGFSVSLGLTECTIEKPYFECGCHYVDVAFSGHVYEACVLNYPTNCFRPHWGCHHDKGFGVIDYYMCGYEQFVSNCMRESTMCQLCVVAHFQE